MFSKLSQVEGLLCYGLLVIPYSERFVQFRVFFILLLLHLWMHANFFRHWFWALTCILEPTRPKLNLFESVWFQKGLGQFGTYLTQADLVGFDSFRTFVCAPDISSEDFHSLCQLSHVVVSWISSNPILFPLLSSKIIFFLRKKTCLEKKPFARWDKRDNIQSLFLDIM